ncbi:DUF4400 domain-containing protein [Thiocystis violacea]|uniref:DUF4400 domain-containing protein n=1 Tax=Thiocystis violacea TaxID=13725 RepID=UPI0019050C4F|nr:DUF4400 domain-containing protein [Thiocystis violacea]MBK1717295.1 hypothetical protein [Thiocystis violacea]
MAESRPVSGSKGGDGSPLIAGLSLFLLLLMGIASLIPTPWLQLTLGLERQWFRASLGERTATAILDQADLWFRQQAEDSGQVAASYVAIGQAGASALFDGVSPAWLNDRLDAFWLLVKLALQRLSLLAAWGPAILALLVGGVLDGHWRWRIRQLGFDYPSPAVRQTSQMALRLVFGLLLLAVFLPFPQPPAGVPILVTGLVILIEISMRHLPKQL